MVLLCGLDQPVALSQYFRKASDCQTSTSYYEWLIAVILFILLQYAEMNVFFFIHCWKCSNKLNCSCTAVRDNSPWIHVNYFECVLPSGFKTKPNETSSLCFSPVFVINRTPSTHTVCFQIGTLDDPEEMFTKIPFIHAIAPSLIIPEGLRPIHTLR